MQERLKRKIVSIIFDLCFIFDIVGCSKKMEEKRGPMSTKYVVGILVFLLLYQERIRSMSKTKIKPCATCVCVSTTLLPVSRLFSLRVERSALEQIRWK